MRKFLYTRKAVTLILTVILSTFNLAETAFAQATTITTHEIEPISDIFDVPCANGGVGEVVVFSGVLHRLTHVTMNGNRTILKGQVRLPDVLAFGLTTGDVYHGRNMFKLQQTGPFSIEAGADEFTFVENLRLIGPSIHLVLHRNIHQTINANGEVTTTVDNPVVVCK